MCALKLSRACDGRATTAPIQFETSAASAARYPVKRLSRAMKVLKES